MMSTQPPIPTPASPVYFDYSRAANSARLSEGELRAIIQIFEADYPSDLMLRELHVLRACNAIARGLITVDAVLAAADSKAA